MNNIINHLLSVVILTLTISCNSIIDNAYTNRAELLKKFEGNDIINRGDIYYMVLRNDSSKQEFFFEKEMDGSKYCIINDSVPNKIEEKEAYERFNDFLTDMKSYGIISFTSEYAKHGILLKINFEKKELYYIESVDSIKNKEWLKFINNANKIDKNWYWRKI